MKSSTISARSYAKINLTLKVCSKRPDTMHNIESNMQFINLHDVVSVSTNEANKVSVEYLNKKMPHNETQDLCYQAATLLNRPVKITVKKNIPFMSGLGGGSSNAATVLLAVKKLYNLSVDLMPLAKKLGSDTPFFLGRHSVLATGIGQTLTNKMFPTKNIILIIPQRQISTNVLYQHSELKMKTKYKNDFQSLVIDSYPDMCDIFTALKTHRPTLTGTGSAIFITHFSKNQLATVKKKISKLKVKSVLITRTCNKIHPIKGE